MEPASGWTDGCRRPWDSRRVAAHPKQLDGVRMTPPMRWLLLALVVASILSSCSTGITATPPCDRPTNQWVLVAQSVPSATFLPCVDALPFGWSVSAVTYESGSYTAWFADVRAGRDALQVTLTAACDVSHAAEVPDKISPSGTRAYEDVMTLQPRLQENRYLTFPGGCITYSFRFTEPAQPMLALEVQRALDVIPRARVQRAVARLGLTLCGAGAPPCPG
jgi:hypothetical protein